MTFEYKERGERGCVLSQLPFSPPSLFLSLFFDTYFSIVVQPRLRNAILHRRVFSIYFIFLV